MSGENRWVLLAARLFADHPSPEDLPADLVVAQQTLPLCFGGFGLRVTTSLETDAALLADAGTTEFALRSAPASFEPFTARCWPYNCWASARMGRGGSFQAPGQARARFPGAALPSPTLDRPAHGAKKRPQQTWPRTRQDRALGSGHRPESRRTRPTDTGACPGKGRS
jgi:hypothetical protein